MLDKAINTEYKEWLQNLKIQIKRTQIKASISVNNQLIMLYWDLGRQIVEKQEKAKWGSGLIDQVSNDLRKDFPDTTGLSKRNLQYCKQFYLFYSIESKMDTTSIVPQLEAQLQVIDNNTDIIMPQLVAQFGINRFFMTPWGHHRLIIDKCRTIEQALFYINKTIENSWSRSVLEYQIETNLYKRQGKAKTNFQFTLPEPESDLANEIMKSEYNFEFLQLSDKTKELELEKALIQHIQDFLTEMGKGFAFMGRQYPIKVGSTDFKIDLLFYHTKLKCHIVIELKARKFEPDFIGKLNFYVNAVNKFIKDDRDGATIGILLCTDTDEDIVDIALDGISRPIGVSRILYTELSEEAKSILPSEKELQEELINFEKSKI